MLEDPWKNQSMCWIAGRYLYVQTAEIMVVRQAQELVNKVNVVGTKESFALDEWQISSDAKDRKAGKFTLLNKNDASKLSFKAESEEDVEERWLKAIKEILDSEPEEEPAPSSDKSSNDEDSTDDKDLTFRLEGYHNFFYQNGDKYEGEWLGGKKHGSGRYIRADGTVYEVNHGHAVASFNGLHATNGPD